MINGEIDLSIGGVYLFAPYLYYELANGHVPLLLAVLISFVACTLIGAGQRADRSFVGISSFVTTLGTLFMLEGFTLIISHAEQVTAPVALAGRPPASPRRSRSVFGAGTYSELIWAVIVVAIMHVVLTRPAGASHTVAVGSNKLGAAEAGISVRWVMIRNFMVCGTFAGFVGHPRGDAHPRSRPGPVRRRRADPVQAIAAVIIGGTLHDRRRGHRDRRADRRAVPGHPPRRPGIKGVNADYLDFYLGLAILLAMTVNIYICACERGRALADRNSPASTSSPRPRHPTMCCGSSTSPRASARRRPARHQPAPAQGRGARPARRQRRRQVDADQDPRADFRSRTAARCGSRTSPMRPRASTTRGRWGSTRVPGPGADRRAVVYQNMFLCRSSAGPDAVPRQRAR